MMTALPTARPAYGLEGPSAGRTEDNATPQGSTYLAGNSVQSNGAGSNRDAVGWSIRPQMMAGIVIDALTMASFLKKPAAGLIHHFDRGSQYASHAFQAWLKEYGMICLMSRKGNCWDNAPTESFFNSLKNERIYGIRYSTRAAAAADWFDYIEPVYNCRRQHSKLGYAPPLKFLEDWIGTQHEHNLAA